MFERQLTVKSHPLFSILPAFSIAGLIPNAPGASKFNKISEVVRQYQSKVVCSLLSNKAKSIPVSYTHLDVYKRQVTARLVNGTR